MLPILKLLPQSLVGLFVFDSPPKASHLPEESQDGGPPAPWATVRLEASRRHPAMTLLRSRADALRRARQLGEHWQPITFACGYLVCDGWNFQDAEGPVRTFCPIPPSALDRIRSVILELWEQRVPMDARLAKIDRSLRAEPSLSDLPSAQFESACRLTLLRANHPAPAGAEDDWLTAPRWAFGLPNVRVIGFSRPPSSRSASVASGVA